MDPRTVTYGYDTTARLGSITDWQSRTTNLSYDSNSNRTGINRPNAVNSAYAYDLADQVTSITHTGPGGTLKSFTYTYDAAANRKSVTTAAGTESYVFDVLNRITSATYTNGDLIEYTYDANGNRLTKKLNSVTQNTYTYDNADQLSSDGSTSFSYDNNGNMTGAGTNTYTWDYANRMTGATVGGTSSTYAYAGDDIRASKTVGGATTSYLWDRESGLPLLVGDGSNWYLQRTTSSLKSTTQTPRDIRSAMRSALSAVWRTCPAASPAAPTTTRSALCARAAALRASSDSRASIEQRAQGGSVVSKLEMIRRLYEYHKWADDRLLDAAARVPEHELVRDANIPFGNARDNLLHILGSQVSWLMRWTGESPQLAKIEPGIVASALSESFGWAHERLRSYIGALSEEQVEAPISFIEFDEGKPHDLERPMWEMLLSVGSHGMGHRGEVAAVLTAAGASPGEIDYSEFAWRRGLR